MRDFLFSALAVVFFARTSVGQAVPTEAPALATPQTQAATVTVAPTPAQAPTETAPVPLVTAAQTQPAAGPTQAKCPCDCVCVAVRARTETVAPAPAREGPTVAEAFRSDPNFAASVRRYQAQVQSHVTTELAQTLRASAAKIRTPGKHTVAEVHAAAQAVAPVPLPADVTKALGVGSDPSGTILAPASVADVLDAAASLTESTAAPTPAPAPAPTPAPAPATTHAHAPGAGG